MPSASAVELRFQAEHTEIVSKANSSRVSGEIATQGGEDADKANLLALLSKADAQAVTAALATKAEETMKLPSDDGALGALQQHCQIRHWRQEQRRISSPL